MPRLRADVWKMAKAEYEVGSNQTQIATKLGVSRKAVQKRIDKEGWLYTPDIEPIIHKQVAEKVAGIVAGSDFQKRAIAIDSEAERRADVLRRHREEPMVVRGMLYAAMNAHKEATKREDKQTAFDDMKAAKISSEVLMNVHFLERKAWNLEENKIEHAITFTDEERLERLAFILDRRTEAQID